MSKYHDILGVSTNASDDDIAKAYKKLLSKYHPDKMVNKTDDEKVTAEKNIRDINDAYDKLVRKKSGNTDYGYNPKYDYDYDPTGNFNFSDLAELLKRFHDQMNKEGYTFEDFVYDNKKNNKTSNNKNKKKVQEVVKANIRVPIDILVNGGVVPANVNIHKTDGYHNTYFKNIAVKIDIPPNTAVNSTIEYVVSDEYKLVLTVNPCDSAMFKVEYMALSQMYYNVNTYVNVDTLTASIGGKVIVTNPYGEKLAINLKPGISNDYKIKIKEAGLLHKNVNGSEFKSDLYVIVNLVAAQLTEDEITQLKKVVDTFKR